MRAIVQHTFGGPEVLELAELPTPEPIATEVQVRVHAAGVNPVDFKTRAGQGVPGLLEPPLTVGWDVAGTVSAVGLGVTRFRVGDEVLGMPWFPREAGAYAEYVTAPSRHFVARPHTLTFAEAAALPLAGLTAWQIIVDALALQAGDDVLIHGAAGGVGHLAVQVAKARGANVFAGARAEQAEWLRELGADQVIDYREQRFEQLLGDLDAVVDLAGGLGERSLGVLRPGGQLLLAAGGVPDELRAAASERRRVTGFLVEPDPVGLAGLVALVEAGRLQVHVDAVVELERAAEAHRLAEDHHGGGKIVLRVVPE
ncbi:MAG: NADP-dependent oxidoreductase [Actinobacteria bacterium]|nr:NADP-dependent oxidoreductase [Actinomycetota bacterium]